MIFPAASLVAALGILAGMIVADDMATNDAGVPHLVPTFGAQGLLLAALWMAARGATLPQLERSPATATLWRSLATTWATGAACAGMVPIRLLGQQLNSERLDGALDVASDVLVLIWLAHLPRAAWRLWRLWQRLPAHQMRAACGFGAGAVCLVALAIAADELGLPFSRAGASYLCYSLAIAAGMALPFSIPRKQPWTIV